MDRNMVVECVKSAGLGVTPELAEEVADTFLSTVETFNANTSGGWDTPMTVTRGTLYRLLILAGLRLGIELENRYHTT